jgi:hypothetical protein
MENIYLIGIIGPSPVVMIMKNRVGNLVTVKVSGFEFYREYPVHPEQWYIKD